MKKKELFKKYNIDESHNKWESYDNWMSVELYRFMHEGNLPPENDMSVMYILDFLDKKNDMKWWVKNVMVRSDWGGLYLTAKRMVYALSDDILKDLNK
jgi:hypothetical protein